MFFLLSHQLQGSYPRSSRVAPGLHCFDEGQSPSHLPTNMGFPLFHSIVLQKHIVSFIIKDATLLLPLVTWNSHHPQAMDYMIYIKIFSFQLINAFCFNCACAISNPYQIHIWAIYGSPPLPKIGLWTWSPRFLSGFTSP